MAAAGAAETHALGIRGNVPAVVEVEVEEQSQEPCWPSAKHGEMLGWLVSRSDLQSDRRYPKKTRTGYFFRHSGKCSSRCSIAEMREAVPARADVGLPAAGLCWIPRFHQTGYGAPVYFCLDHGSHAGVGHTGRVTVNGYRSGHGCGCGCDCGYGCIYLTTWSGYDRG